MFKKNIILLLAMASLLSMPILVFADTKISNVSIKIEVDDEDTSALPDLEITAKGKNYSVDGYEITIGLDGEDLNMNEDDINNIDDDQDEANGPGAISNNKSTASSSTKKKKTEPVTCEITLSAEDGYYFNTMSKKNIKVTGLGANCTKATRQDSKKTLVLTVQLPDIKSRIGIVEEATWKENCIATWESAANANTYELRLYRDGKATGKTYETEARTFNFAPYMLKTGQYTYTVKAIDVNGESSKRCESDQTSITEALVSQYKERYKVEYEKSNPGEGPSSGRKILNGGWQMDNGRYWYRLDDGMFPQASWLNLGDDWYWFDEDGYMISNEWKSWKGNEYYFGSDGKMITNGKTPDGSKVDSSGKKIN